jgi:hypothetical protein
LIHFYDPETKRQSQQWIGPNSPKPKKCKSIKSAQKVMILVFFDYQGIIYIHEAPEKQAMTGKYYGEVIEKKVLPKLHNKTVGFCIKTMHPRTHQISLKNFSRDWASKLCHTLHIVQIWLNVTSGCSQI